MNTMTATAEITRMQTVATAEWVNVCELDDLLPDTGLCALVNQQQVAIFNSRRLNELFAVANFDPISEANVLSRGIIGSIGEAVVVASPIYKQHFNLRNGECLEKPEFAIATYPIRAHGGWVQIKA